MLTVPVRAAPLLLAMRNVTEPFPSPVADDAIVIHGALLLAVHMHPVSAVTATLAVPPPALMFVSSGASVNRQGAASCDTRTRSSLIAMSAWRADGAVLDATRKVTVAVPWPDAGEISVIQLACVDAVHAHSG